MVGLCKNICKIKFNENDISKIIRLGKVTEDKERPLLVTISEEIKKREIFRNLNKIRDAGSPFNKVTITHDMTKKQKEELKIKIETAKEMEQKDNSDEYMYRVRGPPWNWYIKTDTKDDALNSIMLSNNEKRRKISIKKQKYKYKEINQSPNKWKKKTAKIPNKRLDVLLKQHEQKNYCGRFCYCSPVANRKRKSTAHKETKKGSCRRVGYIGLTACVQNPIYIYIYINLMLTKFTLYI